jgi:uncharacterized protein
MKLLVTGSSGFVGSALVPHLRSCGHEVFRLVRRSEPAADARFLDPAGGSSVLDGIDGVINLAGESIATGRWTRRKKERILTSRLEMTGRLAELIRTSEQRPRVLVSASAIGYYGDRGAAYVTEEDEPGSGFLAEVCQRWEATAREAEAVGVRVALPRFGIVLDAGGGALKRMVRLFRFGLGGRLGSGQQYVSWISLEDLVRAIAFVLDSEAARGPINAVAPEPVTNREFTRALARAVRRPAWFPVPACILRLAVGEMADAALLSSCRASSARLEKLGFSFMNAELGTFLEKAAKRVPPPRPGEGPGRRPRQP